MISKRSFVQCSSLRHVPRVIQDVTRDPQPELLARVVSRPSWFFSGSNRSSRRRYASTVPLKPKPTVHQAPIYPPKTVAAAASSGTKRVAPNVSGTAATYAAYGSTKKLFEICAAQADYKVPQASQKDAEIPMTANGEQLGVGKGWWYQDVGLLPTFASWSQVTFLHMYLITVRLRSFKSNEAVQEYSRHLIDHFSHEAETRMDLMHGITARGIRVKYLKDLFLQWRGVLVAYDEGLVKGDAVLGAAVWRNVFKGAAVGPDGQELDWTQIARIVAYMRRVLVQLAAVDDASIVEAICGVKGNGAKGGIFALNQLDEQLANRKSKGWNEPMEGGNNSSSTAATK